ncbi:MAG: hypothetical protein Q7R64_02445 [bacterium]|nr:hypothetical protein [bacterium]
MITYYTKAGTEEDTPLPDLKHQSEFEPPPIELDTIPRDTVKKFVVGDIVKPILVPMYDIPCKQQITTSGPFIVSFADRARYRQTISLQGIPGRYASEFFNRCKRAVVA